MQVFRSAPLISVVAVGVLLASILAVGVVRLGSYKSIDGWPIGQTIECGTDSRCSGLLPVAVEGFDRRDPDHPPVASVTLHVEAAQADGTLVIRSGGCCRVAVFQLVDGSTRAIGVGYVGIDTIASTVDYGP